MQNAFSFLFRRLVAVGPTLYGSFGMVGADGTSVEPSQTCSDWPIGCQATGSKPHTACATTLRISLPDIGTLIRVFQQPLSTRRTIRPMACGTPIAQNSLQNFQALINLAQATTGHNALSDGRFLFKDATA